MIERIIRQIKLATVLYFDENENPLDYQYPYNKAKMEHWMKHNSDFRYDLEIGLNFETQLYEMLGKKIEVKRDMQCLETGNIFVEYESRNKPSGIATSEADYYCYFLNEKRCVIVEKDELKQMCRKYIKTTRDVLGGDSNTSKGILLPLKDFF